MANRAAESAPDPVNDDQIVIGCVIGTHGLNGAVRVRRLSDVAGRFEGLQSVLLGGPNQSARRFSVTGRRLSPEFVILSLEGVGSVEAAKALVGAELRLPITEVSDPPPGQYRHFDLLDLPVYRENGTFLGRIADIQPTGSNDIFVVRDGSREVLIPAIRDVVREIDLKARRMVIRPIQGLLDDDES